MTLRPSPTPNEVLASQDFIQGGFRPHGEFTCWMDNSILMWEACGPFNLEALQAFGRMRRAAFERWHLDDHPLAAIMRWTSSALMSPEAFEFYERSFEAFIQSRHNYVAIAWVGDASVEGLDLMRLKYAPLFERHHLAFALFAAIEPAQRWVAPLLRHAQQSALP